MGVGKWLAAAAGGVGGFFVGGPAGAAVGAGLGYAAGGAAEGAMGGSSGGGTTYKMNPDNPDYHYGGQRWVAEPTRRDPRAGRWVSGADDRADQYNALGQHMGSRDIYDVDYTTADQDYARQQEARAKQMALGQQYQDVIDGKAPSVAEMQMRAGQDATAQQALNMAASARGGGGMLAAQQAQQANALGQQRVGMEAGMLRAQETAQARDAYGNLLNNVRGGDMSAMGARAGMAQAQTENYREQERQRDAMAMGYRQQADNIRQGQRDTNLSLGQSNQSMYTAMATGQQQAAAAEKAAYIGGAAGVVGNGLGAAASLWGGKKKDAA